MSETTPNNEHVILLHGISKSAQIMRFMQSWLEKAGYITHNINYPSTSFSIEKIAQQKISPFVDHVSEQARQVHFVTHSMGGIVLRAYLQNMQITNLGRIVMLAPPNHGSEVSQFFRYWPPYGWIYGPAGQQLVLHGQAAIHKQLAETDANIGIIAGNWTFEFWFRWLFQGNNDGKVSVKSTRLEQMRDHMIVPFSHGNIIYSQHVAKQSIRFLQRGKFLHGKQGRHKKAPAIAEASSKS